MPGTRYARLIMIAVAVVVIVGMIVSMLAIPFTS
jgi:putative copper export protein